MPSPVGMAFFFALLFSIAGVHEGTAFVHEPCRYRSDISPHIVRAAAYRSAGYSHRARAEYWQAIAKDSACGDLWALLAQCYQELGYVDSCIAAGEKALSLDSSLEDAYTVLADAYAVRDPARAAFYALGALERNQSISAKLRAAYFLRAVDTARAISLLKEVVQTVPVEDIGEDLIELCLSYRDTLQAKQLMRWLLFEFPDRVEIALNLASLYIQHQQWDSAWVYLRGAVYHLESAEVSAALSQWLSFINGSTPTHILLTTAQFLLQRSDLPCSHALLLARMMSERQHLTEAHRLIAHAFMLKQLQRNEAFAALDLLAEIEGAQSAQSLLQRRDSLYHDRWVPLAMYYLARQYNSVSPSERDHYLDQALERDSSDPMVLFYAAFRADSLGQWTRAIELYERILFFDPANPVAANNLAYILAEHGQRLFYAEELAERALMADSTNPSYLDTYGWVLYKMGRYDEALPYLKRAVELLTRESATLFEHLGDNYNRLGNTEQAHYWWRRAYEADRRRTYLLDRFR